MCGIAIVWNLNVAVKFFVNSLWNAEMILLTINKESLFVTC